MDTNIDFRLIKLFNANKHAIVSVEDADFLTETKWYYRCEYARRSTMIGDKNTNICMHREIAKRMGIYNDKKVIDHINGCKLDNRRINLRCVTHSENRLNRNKCDIPPDIVIPEDFSFLIAKPVYRPIILGHGYSTDLDYEDFIDLYYIGWCLSKQGYPIAHYCGKNILMHQEIIRRMGISYDTSVSCIDHIDRNKLNNHRNNLRIVPYSINVFNKERKNQSGLRGVSWLKTEEKWVAQIGYNKKNINLGRFNTKEEAYLAYLKKKDEFYGEYL